MQKRDEKDFKDRNAAQVAHLIRLTRGDKATRYGTGLVAEEFFGLPVPGVPEDPVNIASYLSFGVNVEATDIFQLSGASVCLDLRLRDAATHRGFAELPVAA